MSNTTQISPRFNSSVSVDCVIFGFDGKLLKVLLIKLQRSGAQGYKLPGSMIYENEDLTSAAYRVLENMTGLSNIFLKQLQVFSEPDRIIGADLEWIKNYYNIETQRVVTSAYYALVKLGDKIERFTKQRGAKWIDIDSIKQLGLDHKEIVMCALDTLSEEFTQFPVAFELLPRKFTIRQLQNLYQAVLGIDIDSRNFRKKIIKSGYLTLTEEKEVGVAHKPARYYMFNKSKYEKECKTIKKRSRLYL